MADSIDDPGIARDILHQVGDLAAKKIEQPGPFDVVGRFLDRLPESELFWFGVVVVFALLIWRLTPAFLAHSRQKMSIRREWDHKDRQLQEKLVVAQEKRERQRQRADERRKEKVQ